jgi:hypothetical protein
MSNPLVNGCKKINDFAKRDGGYEGMKHADVSKFFFIGTHQPMQKRGAAAGVADDIDRLLDINLPVGWKKYLIQQPEKNVDRTHDYDDEQKHQRRQESSETEMTEAMVVHYFGYRAEIEIKYAGWENIHRVL